MSKLAEWLKQEGLYGLTPRTRCMCCQETVAQIRGRDERGYAILDGQWVEEGGDYISALKDSGWLCSWCMEQEHEYGNRIVYCEDGERSQFLIGEYIIQDLDDSNISGYIFDNVILPYAQGLTYHHTDAWRGHYDGTAFNSSWTKVLDGWFGTIDGHNVGDNDLGKFHEQFQVNQSLPDCPMLVAFPRTSNICACGIEVYVPKPKVGVFEEWLGVETLEVE